MADQRPPQQITGTALREQLLATARKQAEVIVAAREAAATIYQQTARQNGTPPAGTNTVRP